MNTSVLVGVLQVIVQFTFFAMQRQTCHRISIILGRDQKEKVVICEDCVWGGNITLLIFYFLKKKGVGRHRLSGLGAPSAVEHCLKLVEGHAVFAHFNQCADNGSHHVA